MCGYEHCTGTDLSRFINVGERNEVSVYTLLLLGILSESLQSDSDEITANRITCTWMQKVFSSYFCTVNEEIWGCDTLVVKVTTDQKVVSSKLWSTEQCP